MITCNNISLDDSVFTANSYSKLSVIDECYNSLINETGNNFVLSTMNAYTHSLVNEMLDNVKNVLLNLYQQVLSLLNNYILNNVKLVHKYTDLIKTRYEKLEDPMTYEYYEYPDSTDYPEIISSSFIDNDINKLQRKIKDEPNQAEGNINNAISVFSKQVLLKYADINDLKTSTTTIVTKMIKGKAITKVLTMNQLDKFLKEIDSYKKDKEDITKTKNAIIADYQALKHSYSNTFKYNINIDKMHSIVNREEAELEAHTATQFANINMQMIKMFNSFIIIYQTAFNTKLNLLTEKIELNRSIITALLYKTSIFTEVNTKNPKTMYSKEYKYEPKLKM